MNAKPTNHTHTHTHTHTHRKPPLKNPALLQLLSFRNLHIRKESMMTLLMFKGNSANNIWNK